MTILNIKNYIKEIGNKNDIINNPQNAYTKNLINSYPKNNNIKNDIIENSKEIIFDIKKLSINWKKSNIFNIFKKDKKSNNETDDKNI